jgi:hypothetical protein
MVFKYVSQLGFEFYSARFEENSEVRERNIIIKLLVSNDFIFKHISRHPAVEG